MKSSGFIRRSFINHDSFFLSLCIMLAGLWGLVNNAAILSFSPIEWTPVSTFKRLAEVNLWGMVDVTKTFLPLVKKARGRVVNMSSAAGKYSQTFCKRPPKMPRISGRVREMIHSGSLPRKRFEHIGFIACNTVEPLLTATSPQRPLRYN